MFLLLLLAIRGCVLSLNWLSFNGNPAFSDHWSSYNSASWIKRNNGELRIGIKTNRVIALIFFPPLYLFIFFSLIYSFFLACIECLCSFSNFTHTIYFFLLECPDVVMIQRLGRSIRKRYKIRLLKIWVK